MQESTVAVNVNGSGDGIASLDRVPRASGIEVYAGQVTEIDDIASGNDCYAFAGAQLKDGLAAGDGHLNLTYPTATCPGTIANPLLGSLAENGGPTQTMALASASPAIDQIPPTAASGCTPTDQRGIPRPV
ncbi:MAG TPA: choice-of-anchor Q domain-containing protein, partial [Streptosporangiaceae bacterium]